VSRRLAPTLATLFTIFVPETITPGIDMITKLDVAHDAPGTTLATAGLYA
jgi:hypothetical protein